jgi:hypothetical protein
VVLRFNIVMILHYVWLSLVWVVVVSITATHARSVHVFLYTGVADLRRLMRKKFYCTSQASKVKESF